MSEEAENIGEPTEETVEQNLTEETAADQNTDEKPEETQLDSEEANAEDVQDTDDVLKVDSPKMEEIDDANQGSQQDFGSDMNKKSHTEDEGSRDLISHDVTTAHATGNIFIYCSTCI